MEETKSDHLIIVEGFYSAMYLAQEGFQNVIAIMGTNASKIQLNRIKELSSNITLLLDGDSAGKNGTERLREQLVGVENVQIVEYPNDSKQFKPIHFSKEYLQHLLEKN